MEKQKICIVGGGLTGLITAITLSKLNLKIDLITGNINQYTKSNRTIAISQNNYDFLKKLRIFKFSKKEFWPCSKMKLYTEAKKKEFTEIFGLNRDKKQKKQILYMMENSTIAKHLIRNIKEKNVISLKTHKTISEIASCGLLKSVKFKSKNNSKYNLIIICTGSNSRLVKTLFNDQSFEHSYGEVSITTTLKHNFVKNNVAKQIFLNNEILALLPMSNTKTSVVWSVKKNIADKYKGKKDSFLKNKIKFYTKDFIKKAEFVSNIEFKNLNFFIRKKYFQDRVLLFGDALHQVHPLAGQGFNMTLRDLANLEKTLTNKINLGLDVGSSDVLSELSDEIKPRNFVHSIGIDFIKNCFSFEKKIFKDLRNKIITELNKNNFIKDQFLNFADNRFKL